MAKQVKARGAIAARRQFRPVTPAAQRDIEATAADANRMAAAVEDAEFVEVVVRLPWETS